MLPRSPATPARPSSRTGVAGSGAAASPVAAAASTSPPLQLGVDDESRRIQVEALRRDLETVERSFHSQMALLTQRLDALALGAGHSLSR